MNIFAENAMLELSYLKSLHLKSTKQKRLFLTLMAKCFAIWQSLELWWSMNKKSVKLSYWIHEQYKHQKHLNVFY